MRTFLAILVVVGLAAAAGWYFTGPGSAAGQACAKLQTLCGEELMPAQQCREDLDERPESQLEDLKRCVEPADSCLEVTGCLAGSAARDLARGAVRGLLD